MKTAKKKKTPAKKAPEKKAPKKPSNDESAETPINEKKEASKLTIKERRFIHLFINGGEGVHRETVEPGNQTQAAGGAGYQSRTSDGLRSLACELRKRLALPISQLMDEAGLDDLCLLQKLRHGLNAYVTKTASFKGEITDQIDMIDFEVRERYLETALKIKGKFAPVEVKGSFTADVGERLAQAIERAHGKRGGKEAG